MKGTKTSWRAMIYRCTSENARSWERYGGRGIAVCDRWMHSFENFLADMGLRPTGRSIDRIDGNGNYEPGNCRWATPVEQNQSGRKGGIPPGRKPAAGTPRSYSVEFRLAEHEFAEVSDAVPKGELSALCRTLLLDYVRS